MFRFYIAFYMAKLTRFLLKILRRNASFFPGKVAVTICPDFLGKISKPEKIIGVTGTNGKTTVCNLLIKSLEDNGYKVLDNRLGSNVNSGLASTFIAGTNLLNKSKYEIAVLEIDERSSPKIYPYVKPTYLICTNLFRDSIRRNANPEFISGLINKELPKETKLILNADDLISGSLGKENEKVYFAIDKLDTDLTESINIINDMRICPQCNTKLKYNYVRYHHIGNAYCPNCDFKSPEADYRVTKIDYENNKILVKHKNEECEYKMISDSIFNIYNTVAVIALLKELGIETKEIQKNIEEAKIVGSRYKKEQVKGINIISHMAKGQNPVACSCVFDYVKKEKGKKEVILLIYDLHDAEETSENIAWLYECDFEFLNSESIDKVIIGGPRAEDFYLRLLIAGVPKDKLVFTDDTQDTVEHLSLKKNKDIYVLYDLYTEHIALNVCKKIEEKINQK